MENTQSYIQANKQRFLDELIELLKIPSVSADPAFTADVAKTAESVAQSLRDAGADNVEICKTEGHPIVYADRWPYRPPLHCRVSFFTINIININ